MNIPDDRNIVESTTSLKTSSAVTPSLLLTLICLPSASAAAYFSSGTTQTIFITVGVLPAILTILQILYFTVFDRDRLHNEGHIERKMLIAKIYPQIGDGKSHKLLTVDKNLVENPNLEGGG